MRGHLGAVGRLLIELRVARTLQAGGAGQVLVGAKTMFLNQVNYLWRDLGWASGRRAALLLIGPLALMALLVIPAALGAPPIATHVELSGTGTRTGPEAHLGGSSR